MLSICPIHLKKANIGSLPEIAKIRNQNIKTVVDSLERMLEEDSLVVPVLETFANIYSDNQLQKQVISISCS